MKYILILIIFFISSCTTNSTNVLCPCQVSEIQEHTRPDGYRITVKSIDYKPSIFAGPRYFSFYTTHLYNIGDTIK